MLRRLLFAETVAYRRFFEGFPSRQRRGQGAMGGTPRRTKLYGDLGARRNIPLKPARVRLPGPKGFPAGFSHASSYGFNIGSGAMPLLKVFFAASLKTVPRVW